jgi:hypothetical protein
LTNPSSDELNYLLLCKSKELIYQDDANRQKIWDKGFVSIDLMTLLFSSKLRVGLKELQVTLQYPNVEEFDWSVCENDILPEKYRQTLIDYNVNDVLSTK